MTQAKQIKAWSFSRYNLYTQCPAKAKYEFIDKLKEPKSEAMARGAKLHDDAEAYEKGKRKTNPFKSEPAKSELLRVRKLWRQRAKLALAGQAPIVEDMWSFTREWSETTWNDWTGCWVRIKLDAAVWLDEETLEVTDWKSGKFHEDQNQQYLEQLDLYALGAFLKFEHLLKVLPRLVYVDAGVIFPDPAKPIVYTRDDLPRLKKRWEGRTKKMLADRLFSPRPGWYCQGCYFNHSTKYGWGKNKKPKPAGPCKF